MWSNDGVARSHLLWQTIDRLVHNSYLNTLKNIFKCCFFTSKEVITLLRSLKRSRNYRFGKFRVKAKSNYHGYNRKSSSLIFKPQVPALGLLYPHLSVRPFVRSFVRPSQTSILVQIFKIDYK